MTRKPKVKPMFKFGDRVYHVANPAIMGVILNHPTDPESSVTVLFEQPVSFSGNVTRGYEREWGCNPALLFETAEEALAAHKPGR